MKKRYLGLLLLSTLFACSKKDPVPVEKELPPPAQVSYTPDNSFKIVAYFPSYRDPALVDDNKYKMITHLNYAFLNPNPDGSLAALENPGRMAAVMAKARAAGVKTGISVSGTRANFDALAASAGSRSTFINNVVSFVLNNNLDGVDMDWEYPSTANGTSETFVLLMKDLSEALHARNKYLSAAITPGVYAGSIKDGIKPEVFKYVDFFNIMVYDGAGWDSAQPLQHASYAMAVRSLDVWLIEKGMPKEKAVLGIPAYGRGPGNSSRSYREIEGMGIDTSLDFAMVGQDMFYFNGTRTVKEKAQLAKSRANGLMFWEFYMDTNNNNSLLKAANDAILRAY